MPASQLTEWLPGSETLGLFRRVMPVVDMLNRKYGRDTGRRVVANPRGRWRTWAGEVSALHYKVVGRPAAEIASKLSKGRFDELPDRPAARLLLPTGASFDPFTSSMPARQSCLCAFPYALIGR